MSSYIIRLDDACPTMNHQNWNRMEELLGRYGVKPIVGVIPDNQDPDFSWERDSGFWEKVRIWQKKGWTIAQHGLHHILHSHEPGGGYFQKSHSSNTEFAGVRKEEQKQMLLDGLHTLQANGVEPTCFFAPAHTYDENTVEALQEIPQLQFISDGYALSAYQKHGMIFLPSVCDGPFEMPLGVYTYVFHPSVMKDAHFLRLERFLERNHQSVINAEDAVKTVRKNQGILGCFLENSIYLARGIRNKLR